MRIVLDFFEFVRHVIGDKGESQLSLRIGCARQLSNYGSKYELDYRHTGDWSHRPGVKLAVSRTRREHGSLSRFHDLLEACTKYGDRCLEGMHHEH